MPVTRRLEQRRPPAPVLRLDVDLVRGRDLVACGRLKARCNLSRNLDRPLDTNNSLPSVELDPNNLHQVQ